MQGGLPRRATYLTAQGAGKTALRVDNGDLTEAGGRQDELKAETLLRFFNTFHYSAVNLGEKDYALGLSHLLYLRALAEVPLLSANVVFRGTGQPLFAAYTLADLEVAGQPLKAALIGVLAEQFAPELEMTVPELEVQPVADVLERLGGELPRQADLFVLLYHGPREEAQVLAPQFPWLHVLVAAHVSEDPIEPLKSGPTLIVHAGEKAKFLGGVAIGRDQAGRVQVAALPPVEMGPDLADEATARGLLNDYLEKVKAEDLLGKMLRRAPPNGGRFAGTPACQSCHEEAHRLWQGTRHAQAYASLQKVGHDFDPDCVGCHVVGLAYEGGFVDLPTTPGLADVGCESCHGPLAAHAAGEGAPPLLQAGEAACQTCHTPDHSPGFDFGPYWEKVRHDSRNGLSGLPLILSRL